MKKLIRKTIDFGFWFVETFPLWAIFYFPIVLLIRFYIKTSLFIKWQIYYRKRIKELILDCRKYKL